MFATELATCGTTVQHVKIPDFVLLVDSKVMPGGPAHRETVGGRLLGAVVIPTHKPTTYHCDDSEASKFNEHMPILTRMFLNSFSYCLRGVIAYY